jgi:hypothetical protein
VVSSMPEVRQQAEVAFEMYRSADVDYFPGVAVWRDPEDPANSLTICVIPDCIALIHTDEDYFQRVTDSGREPDGLMRRIQLDDFIEVPDRCFTEKEAALETVAFWMENGTLPESANFTANLFE